VAAAPILMASPVRRGQEAGGGGKGHNMISFLGWVAWTKESEKGGAAATDRLKRWRIGVRRRGGGGLPSDSGQQWPGHGGRGRVAVGDPRGRGGARGG
jgi:hypothetical protein